MSDQKNDSQCVGVAGNLAQLMGDLCQFIPQPIYYADCTGAVVEANRAMTDLTGYRDDEIIGKLASSLFTNNADITRVERETAAEGKVRARGVMILTKDRKEVPAVMYTSSITNRDGKITGYLATLSEVTEYKQTQDRIEQAARGWRATLDAIRDLVWISDKNCQLIRVNRAYARAVGMEPKELVGKICYEVLAWAKETCPSCPHQHTFDSKESAMEEIFNHQQKTHLEISTSPILNDNNEVIASVCVARDVTDRKQAEKEIQVLNRLKQYFSPKLAQRLLTDEELYKVRRKELTIFFIDIRNFTMISDRLEPEELLNMLNEYFTQMTEIIFNWGGTVGKFIGDGIMGFFGDPEEYPNHAELAVKMALEMQSRIKIVNEKSYLWGDLPIAIGIGINTGYVTIGNIGPESYRDYTVIGKQVNLTARLTEEAKPGQVLISHRTYRFVADIAETEKIGEISFKGFDKPVLVYNVTGLLKR